MRLLVVEDTRATGTNMERRLKGWGDVRLASGVREAGQMVASGFVPDIVLTDMHLRDGESWEQTIPRLRAMLPHAQIFAMTTQPDAAFRRRFKELFDSIPLVDKLELGGVETALSTFRETLSGGFTRTVDMSETRETQAWQDHGVERWFVERLGVPADDPVGWMRDWVRCRKIWVAFWTWALRGVAAVVAVTALTTLATRGVDYLLALVGAGP